MARTRLTSWRMPFQVEELRSQTLVVGVRGQSGELARKYVRSIELQDHGGVLVGFQHEDEPTDHWVFTAAGYGRVDAAFAEAERQAEFQRRIEDHNTWASSLAEQGHITADIQAGMSAEQAVAASEKRSKKQKETKQ